MHTIGPLVFFSAFVGWVSAWLLELLAFPRKGQMTAAASGGVQRVLVAFHHSASAAGQNNKPLEAHGEHFHSDTAGWNQNNLQDAQNKPDDINTHDK